jgi:hypothetical protein
MTLSLNALHKITTLNFSKSINSNFTQPQQDEFLKLGNQFFFQLREATKKNFEEISSAELKQVNDSLAEYIKELEGVSTRLQATAKFFADAAAIIGIVELLVAKAPLIT